MDSRTFYQVKKSQFQKEMYFGFIHDPIYVTFLKEHDYKYGKLTPVNRG
jgi:hypothetical protein